jgi:Helix-turn-helix domain
MSAPAKQPFSAADNRSEKRPKPSMAGKLLSSASAPTSQVAAADLTPEPPLTLSVPEAGWKYFGMSRNASYAAAERGDIPTVRIGKLIRVPVRALERMLDTVTPGHETAE